jgi:hypothetical protein
MSRSSTARLAAALAPLLLLGAALDAAGAADPDLRLQRAAVTLSFPTGTQPLLADALREELHRLAAARAGQLGRRGHVARIPSRSPGPASGRQLTIATCRGRVESLSKADQALGLHEHASRALPTRRPPERATLRKPSTS